MGVLDGRAVVITGAGRGLGRAYAVAAARAGASVVVNDIVAETAQATTDLLRRDGAAAVTCPGDVSVWDVANGLVETCRSEFGRIDGLVNNAGILSFRHPEEEDEPTLRRLVEVNVLGTMFCGTLAMRAMLEQGSGSIVNVTSGAHLGMMFTSAYGATKGAAASATYTWANEMAKRGVRVNAISPNADTGMNEVAKAYLGDRYTGPNRGVAPEVNAPVVVYLLSDLSSGLNGQVVRINDRELSLMAHPAVLEPVLTADAWDVDGIAAAFDDVLGLDMPTLGLARVPRS